ncbi:DUF4184 family protein [Streptomyces sp. RPA4-5]|uniref:DUF4184 family protein n=1 Tax=Streptomyces TaxID=1883 RepID=UPI00143EE115|nr:MULTISPECIES: DUF4184 family protein [Streptomyces]MCX4633747.1 DUF4184 family protein [Streptomyces platensis]QIY54973.1 DUF4184 family protein [Streptomyces sp. RPA4-5]WJY37654.1 DUF4184 family protein [Streptomyces sp. P9-2B-2]
MPFTLSHAAAVLPAIRRNGAARGPLVASALVAGSFAPDMTYYADSLVPGGMAFGDFTHSLPGVLTVDVLVTAALVGGWLLVREPLTALVPRAWRGTVHTFVRGRSWRPQGPRELAALVGWFVVSAVLGAVTHVVWDAFTHPGRWGTRLVPVLDQVVGGLPLYTYVQYGTSALALVAMSTFAWPILRRRDGDGAAGAAVPVAVPDLTVRLRLLLTALLALCVAAGAGHRVLRARAVFGPEVSALNYLPTALFGAGAGLVLGLPLYGVAVRLVHRRSLRDRAADATGLPPTPAERTVPRAAAPSGAADASTVTPSGAAATSPNSPSTTE